MYCTVIRCQPRDVFQLGNTPSPSKSMYMHVPIVKFNSQFECSWFLSFLVLELHVFSALLGFGFCVCALRRRETAAGNTPMTHFPVRRQQDTLKLEDGYKSSCIAGEDGGKGNRETDSLQVNIYLHLDWILCVNCVNCGR